MRTGFGFYGFGFWSGNDVEADPTDVPVNMVPPVITGVPQVGEPLVTSTGIWTNAATSYAYQWYRDGSPIGSATSFVYTLDALDEGTDITVGVIASNIIGPGTEAFSAAVGPIVGAGGELDTALVAPTISVAVAQNEWPIVLNAVFDVSTLSTDYVRIELADNEAFTSPDLDTRILVGTGNQNFPGLSLINSGENWIRERIERDPYYGPWSTVVKHGDTTAPTITSSSSMSEVEGVVDPTGTLTADETVTWSISGGADSSYYSVNASTGDWVIDATTDYNVKNLYAAQFKATDLAGNFATQNFSYNVLDAPSGDPTTWNPAAKSSFITLSAGDLTATGTDGVGAPCPVIATNSQMAGKWYLEIHWQPVGAFVNSGVGFANALTADFSDPGDTNDAISFKRNTLVRYNNSDQGTWAGGESDNDYVAMLAVDCDNSLCWIGKDGVWTGDPAAGSGGFTAPITTFFPMFFSTLNDVATIRCTSADFDYTPPTGFTGWDD